MGHGHFYKSLKQLLPRSSVKTVKRLEEQLSLIKQEYRTCILIDCCKITLKCAEHLSLLIPDTAVLQFADDFFVFRKKLLLEHLNHIQDRVTFVDVSHHLAIPEILSHLKYDQNVSEMVTALIGIVSENNLKTIKCEKPNASWNHSTAFGILLGYPVVYWYSDLEEANTCLNNVDLVVNKVISNQLPEYSISQFSYPSLLLETFKPLVASWKDKEYPEEEFSLGCSVISLSEVVL